MNKNRKITRKYTDNKDKIRVHMAIGRIDEGKRHAMKIIKKEANKWNILKMYT